MVANFEMFVESENHGVSKSAQVKGKGIWLYTRTKQRIASRRACAE